MLYELLLNYFTLFYLPFHRVFISRKIFDLTTLRDKKKARISDYLYARLQRKTLR